MSALNIWKKREARRCKVFSVPGGASVYSLYWKTCYLKVQFRTQQEAVNAIVNMIKHGKTHPGEMHVYKCPNSLCGEFHIGHLNGKGFRPSDKEGE